MSTPTKEQAARVSALEQKMKVLAAEAIREGIPCRAVEQFFRQRYRDEAAGVCGELGLKPTTATMAVVSGHTRKFMVCEDSHSLWESSLHYHRLESVIQGWLDEYPDTRELPNRGKKDSFEYLCRKYTGDIPPRAIEILGMRYGILDSPTHGSGTCRLLVNRTGASIFGGRPSDHVVEIKERACG